MKYSRFIFMGALVALLAFGCGDDDDTGTTDGSVDLDATDVDGAADAASDGAMSDASDTDADMGPACEPNGSFCLETEYCMRPLGFCREPGECTTRPKGCSGDYDPVCGCDGLTYANDCAARVSGTSVDYEGACKGDEACEVGGIFCSGTEYCARPTGSCGEPGECMPRPGTCAGPKGTVCGCDGVTYENTCAAWGSGSSVDHEGACEGA